MTQAGCEGSRDSHYAYVPNESFLNSFLFPVSIPTSMAGKPKDPGSLYSIQIASLFSFSTFSYTLSFNFYLCFADHGY